MNKIDLNPKVSNQNFPNDSNSQFVLPRQGWQDKQAFVQTVIKAKRALDIAEISHLLN
ncbi:MAG: hypothetical protein RLZZ535_2773 [Cyanobacteriota bacterium]|jgi:hypothetical protein